MSATRWNVTADEVSAKFTGRKRTLRPTTWLGWICYCTGWRILNSRFSRRYAAQWLEYTERNESGEKIEFDAIVANPPFSYRWEPKEEFATDFRFQKYGVAPKSAADFAFLLHGFHFLREDGTMAIILPHGVLFRGGVEKQIRTKLLKDGNLDAVIGLPANLFSPREFRFVSWYWRNVKIRRCVVYQCLRRL